MNKINDDDLSNRINKSFDDFLTQEHSDENSLADEEVIEESEEVITEGIVNESPIIASIGLTFEAGDFCDKLTLIDEFKEIKMLDGEVVYGSVYEDTNKKLYVEQIQLVSRPMNGIVYVFTNLFDGANNLFSWVEDPSISPEIFNYSDGKYWLG